MKIVNLQAGIGALSFGALKALERNNIEGEIVLATEVNMLMRKELKLNFPHLEIKESSRIIKDPFLPAHDILLCDLQGANNKIHQLLVEFLHVLKLKRPQFFILTDSHPKTSLKFLESLSKNHQNYSFIPALQRLGYGIKTDAIFAHEHGSPQKRITMFIIGKLDNIPLFPSPQAVNPVLEDVIQKTSEPDIICQNLSQIVLKKYSPQELYGKTIRDKRSGNNVLHSWDLELRGPVSPQRKELLEQLISESRRKIWYARKYLPLKDIVPLNIQEISQFSRMQGKTLTESLNALTRQGYLSKDPLGYSISSGDFSFPITHILHPQEPTPAFLPKEGERLGIIDNAGIRRFTVDEVKRLFGFKETFKINPKLSKSQTFNLFGNSAVIPVTEKIAEKLIFN